MSLQRPPDPWLERLTDFVAAVLRGLAAAAGYGVVPLVIIVGFVVAGFWLVATLLDTRGDGWVGCSSVLVIPGGIVAGIAFIAVLEAASKSRRAARELAWLILSALRLAGRLLLLPLRVARHPVRNARGLWNAARSPQGATLLTVAATAAVAWGWVVAEGLTLAHGGRVLVTAFVVAGCVSVAVARPRLGIRVRVSWAVGGLIVAAVCYLSVPASNRTLLSAWRETATLAESLRAAPAEKFDAFRADAGRRKQIASTFRLLAGTLAAAEDEWAGRAATAGLADAQRQMTRDGVLARVRTKQLAQDLADAQAAGVPGSLAEVRRSVLRVRLELAAWSARPDLRGHRFEEAAGRVARNTEELTADAAELGMGDDVARLRDAFAYPAALARAARRPDPP